MSNPSWPGTLPGYVLEQGFGESLAEQVLESPMEVGPAKRRRRYTRNNRVFTASMMMTDSQSASFESFYYTTLIGGTLPFDWVHPRLQTAMTFVFRRPAPKITELKGESRTWSFALEAYTDPSYVTTGITTAAGHGSAVATSLVIAASSGNAAGAGYLNAAAVATTPPPFGSHLAWRFLINSNGGDTQYVTIREAELRTAIGGATATTGGTSFQGGPGSDAGNGVDAPWDGNLNNTWARTISGGYGFFFGYMWSTPKAIIEAAIMASGGRAPVDWKLQWSDDTTNGTDGSWTDAFTAWEPSWDNDASVTDQWRVWPQDFSGGKYKAFRWRFTVANGTFNQIMEIEGHATVGGSQMFTTGAAWAPVAGINGEAYRSFDGNNNDGWYVNASDLPTWVAYGMVTPVLKPAEYSFTINSSAAYTPNAWKLQGSVDGVTWTDLDTRSGITWSTTPQTQTFTVP